MIDILGPNRQKYEQEIGFWATELEAYQRWCDGRIPEMYGIPSPRVKLPDDPEEAIRSAVWRWCNADMDRYQKHLLLEPDAFRDCRLLDIGCGPLPLVRSFVFASEYFGVDPLVSWYRRLGYPLDSQGVEYVEAHAERIPLPDGSIDAIVSVNAIDHVDDFPRAVAEILRVLAPGGRLRLEIHYHEPTVTEPLALDDGKVARAFSGHTVRKVKETPFRDFYHFDNGTLAVWSNF